MDALYGIHAVEEALRARSRSLDHVEVARERHDQRLQALIDLARQEGVSEEQICEAFGVDPSSRS